MDSETVKYSAHLLTELRRVNGRDVEYRSVDAGGLAADGMRFRGYAAVFDSDSEPLPFVERIAPGAFKRSLQATAGGKREVRLFANHNMDQVLATTRNGSLTLSEDGRGLLVDAALPDTTAGRDISKLVESGVCHSMSFGFSVPRGGDSWADDGNTRTLHEVILHEVSVVTGFPAYEATTASVRTDDLENDAEPDDMPAVAGMSVVRARHILALKARQPSAY